MATQSAFKIERSMVLSPLPALWLPSLQRPDEVITTDEAKSCHTETRDSRPYVLDKDVGPVDHRQSALEHPTSALMPRVQGLGKSEDLRPPRSRRRSLSETRDVAGNATMISRLHARKMITGNGKFGTTSSLPDPGSSKSRVTKDTSIKVYVKEGDSCDRHSILPRSFTGMQHAESLLHAEGWRGKTPSAGQTYRQQDTPAVGGNSAGDSPRPTLWVRSFRFS